MEDEIDRCGVEGLVDQEDIGGLVQGEDLLRTGEVGGEQFWLL